MDFDCQQRGCNSNAWIKQTCSNEREFIACSIFPNCEMLSIILIRSPLLISYWEGGKQFNKTIQQKMTVTPAWTKIWFAKRELGNLAGILTSGTFLRTFLSKIADVQALYFLFQTKNSCSIVFFIKICHDEILCFQIFSRAPLWILTAINTSQQCIHFDHIFIIYKKNFKFSFCIEYYYAAVQFFLSITMQLQSKHVFVLCDQGVEELDVMHDSLWWPAEPYNFSAYYW